MKIEASRRLLAERGDVWSLLAEPYHLSDWWPGYTAIRPDRRGFATGARWRVVRGTDVGLLRRPGSDGSIVIDAIEPSLSFAWRDVEQRFRAEIVLATVDGATDAALSIDAPWWRLQVEGLRSTPRQALARLHALCQTADSLAGRDRI